MRALALLLTLGLSLPAAAEDLVAAPGAVRLLVLDVVAKGGVADEQRELMQALLTDSLRGKENLVIARDDDVRRRAPMEADRLGRCEDELCLYEMANALDADWVLYSHIAPQDDGVVMTVGAFSRARGELEDPQVVEAASVSAGSATLTAAMERLLQPVLTDAKPMLFEQPLFLGGAGTLALGILVFAGGGGWALELESNLATPGRFREQKAQALEQGKIALGVTALGAAIAVVGAGLLTWALVSAE